ncbi:MAG: hypothetical protein WDO70_01860 [Alphaproteobacteria bacterium]
MIFKTAILVAALMSLSACAPDEKANLPNAIYDVDIRTGLCYVTSGFIGADGLGVTNVPCTPRVINMLPPTKRGFAIPPAEVAPAPTRYQF